MIADGAWKGRRCFVLAGGPSLASVDLSRLRGELTLGLNVAFLHGPTANLVYDLRLMERLSGDPRWAAYGGEKLWLNSEQRNVRGRFPGVRELSEAVDMYGQQAWGRALARGLYRGNNAGSAAINLAEVLGADPVYLLGYDLRGKGGRSANWHAEYGTWSQEELVYMSYLEDLGRVAKKVRSRVFNLTPGSALRSFPTADLDEVLAGRHPAPASVAGPPRPARDQQAAPPPPAEDGPDDVECVTSASLAYFARCGQRMVRSFLRFVPPPARLAVYCEASAEGRSADDYRALVGAPDPGGRVSFVDLHAAAGPPLAAFLADAEARVRARLGPLPSDPDRRVAHPGYDYRFDAVKFAKKGFAILHALRAARARYVFWIDADAAFRARTGAGFLRSLLERQGASVAYFGRARPHSETGFIAFDTSRLGSFVLRYAEHWEGSRRLFCLPGWTDCDAFDAALAACRGADGFRAVSLSAVPEGPVIALSPLGRHIEHAKGRAKFAGARP